MTIWDKGIFGRGPLKISLNSASISATRFFSAVEALWALLLFVAPTSDFKTRFRFMPKPYLNRVDPQFEPTTANRPNDESER